MNRACVPLAIVAAFACGGAVVSGSAAAPRLDQQPPRLLLLDDTAELDAALAGRSTRRDLVVRVAGVSLPAADPAKTRLLILADLAGSAGAAPSARTTAPFRLASVAYAVENERGQVVARALRRRELAWTSSGTLAFSETVDLPPGSYRVKVAAVRNSKVGSAEAAVAARTQEAATIRFGDVMVGETAGEDLGSSLALDKLIRGDRLVASMAIAGPVGGDVSVVVEVAKDGPGSPLMSAPGALLASEDAVRVARAVVDVSALPPGQYVARAVVFVSGKEAARVLTPFGRERTSSALEPSGAAVPRPKTAPVAAAAVPVAFDPAALLDAAVLGPFLDDLSSRSSASSKDAIGLARAGRFQDAASAAATTGPTDPAKPFLLGLSLLSRKQLQPASEAFRETLRAAPDYFVGAFYIGACYAAGGRDPQAVNAWQTSLVGLEQYPIVFRVLAEALTRMGQADRALETMEEAAAKWPSDPAVRLQTGRAALAAGRFERVFALADDRASQSSADLLFVAMQAVYERATRDPVAAGDDLIARARRYREAYSAAGGTQQALVAEWAAAVERRK